MLKLVCFETKILQDRSGPSFDTVERGCAASLITLMGPNGASYEYNPARFRVPQVFCLRPQVNRPEHQSDSQIVLTTDARRCWVPVWAALVLAARLSSQELQPRAYLPAPVGLNYFSISYPNNTGGLLFDPSLPKEDGHVDASASELALGGSLNAFGRAGQVLAVLPYVVADLSGRAAGIEGSRYRSGLADSLFRFSMNLYGVPAMHLREFAKYRPKTIIGASFSVMAPTGQYDSNVLINLGTNRWAFKPEIGISRFFGKWDLEGAFGMWLYSKNSNFFGHTFRCRTRSVLFRLMSYTDCPTEPDLPSTQFFTQEVVPMLGTRSRRTTKVIPALAQHLELLSASNRRCGLLTSTALRPGSAPILARFQLPIR